MASENVRLLIPGKEPIELGGRSGSSSFVVPHTYASSYDNEIIVDGEKYWVDKIVRTIKTNHTEGGVSGSFTKIDIDIHLKLVD